MTFITRVSTPRGGDTRAFPTLGKAVQHTAWIAYYCGMNEHEDSLYQFIMDLAIDRIAWSDDGFMVLSITCY